MQPRDVKPTAKQEKTKKAKKFKNMFPKSNEESSRLALRNLPYTATENEIGNLFNKFGQISEITVVKRKDGKSTGRGFIKFADRDAAQTAIQHCKKKDFMGRKIRVGWATGQPQKKKVKTENRSVIKDEEDGGRRASRKGTNYKVVKSEDEEEEKEEEEEEDEKNHKVARSSKLQKALKKESHGKKSSLLSTPRNKAKRGRIIVRNLSFQTTEDKLKGLFEQFGAISEIKVLRKDDGKLVGCAFVQFDKKQNAIRAILETSGKEFLGRPIICDWALPKDKYLQAVQSERKPKVKAENEDEIEIKEEPMSEDSDDDVEIKEDIISEESDDETHTGRKTEEDSDEAEMDNSSDMSTYDDEEEEDDDDSDNNVSPRKRKSSDMSDSTEQKRPKVISNDVTEGCTVFVKNIPFSATNKELEKCMKQFGPLHYALVCTDPHREHSLGTGFVKFKKKEDAEKCLESSEQVIIADQSLVLLKALPRNEIKDMHEKKKEKKVKDNRHLYLVKEGVILAGSPAAKDVSVADMERRLKLEQWKSQMLRNLNMFVSNTRLVVYNIPPSWTDDQVRKLFKEHAGPGAVMKEARIMRDLKNVDANGIGKSKEYAFVHFTEHQHALKALRDINNNPNIFTKSKRPIVAFSIENKAIHKIKQKRLLKSRSANMENRRFVKNTGHELKKHKANVQNQKIEEEVESSSYTGMQAKPGNKKMRSKFNMKTQAAAHEQNVRKEKKKQKLKKKSEGKRKIFAPQQKKNNAEEKDSFSKLVDKYKTKLMSLDSQKRWYE